jgi:NADH:ubiquinone oxidoreductase subunit F (NADH-binding)
MSALAGPHGLPRLLLGLDPGGRAMSGAEHARIHGPLPQVDPDRLIAEIDASGLRGRGGADFPTARKLQTLRRADRVSAVVVNGSETEPVSGKDRLLLGRLPHLVLDGAELAARAIGAPEIIVKLGARVARAQPALTQAVEARRSHGVPTHVVLGSDGYVTGEESAVVNLLGGGPELPTFVPPRPYERGYRGRPTLLQNPETLAQIALVARYGATWYRELGTDADPGSALITIGGAVRAPGVYELAFGTTLAELVNAAGGPSEPLQALLIGGYFGSWMQASHAWSLRLAREDLQSEGCALGSGVLFALGDSSCGLHESARMLDYLARQSAGQCGPCVFGLRAIADAVAQLASGLAHHSESARILRWASEIRGRGACHHPNGALRLVESALRVFARDIETHRHARCAARPAGFPFGADPIPGVSRSRKLTTQVAAQPAGLTTAPALAVRDGERSEA